MDPCEVSVLAQLLQHFAQHVSPDDATEALRKVQQAAPHSQMRLEQCFFWMKNGIQSNGSNKLRIF